MTVDGSLTYTLGAYKQARYPITVTVSSPMRLTVTDGEDMVVDRQLKVGTTALAGVTATHELIFVFEGTGTATITYTGGRL